MLQKAAIQMTRIYHDLSDPLDSDGGCMKGQPRSPADREQACFSVLPAQLKQILLTGAQVLNGADTRAHQAGKQRVCVYSVAEFIRATAGKDSM